MNTKPLRHILLLAVLCLAALLTSCKTTGPDDTAYRTIAALEATVDAAMKSWAAHVVTTRDTGSFADLQTLAAQESRVSLAYSTYRASVNSVYSARVTYRQGLDSGATKLDAALATAQAVSTDLLAILAPFIK